MYFYKSFSFLRVIMQISNIHYNGFTRMHCAKAHGDTCYSSKMFKNYFQCNLCRIMIHMTQNKDLVKNWKNKESFPLWMEYYSSFLKKIQSVLKISTRVSHKKFSFCDSTFVKTVIFLPLVMLYHPNLKGHVR